ncbi:hypothetical protein QJS10_CPB18g00615 [Acorus calamus]|uniref:Uncharacterized protein n=1 Tax=Acorus calamus TaxID=4465 RepID=A0AAV9CQH0_ACOCL|nr:hypothetical protein QJS10_CPB18g00615 [Acorus calamus]
MQTREAVRELKEPTATMDTQGDDMDPERMVEDFVNLLYAIISPLFDRVLFLYSRDRNKDWLSFKSKNSSLSLNA